VHVWAEGHNAQWAQRGVVVVTAATVVALVVALGGWVLAGVIAWLNYRTKTEEIFLRALDWLSGGTQKRNMFKRHQDRCQNLKRIQSDRHA
jgi:hypothetical protein